MCQSIQYWVDCLTERAVIGRHQSDIQRSYRGMHHREKRHTILFSNIGFKALEFYVAQDVMFEQEV